MLKYFQVYLERLIKMNNNFDNNTNFSPEASLYDSYLSDLSKRARKTYSRVFIGLFLFFISTYIVIFGAQAIIILSLGKEAAADIFNNVYINWLFGVAPMYLIGFPVLFFTVKGMKTVEREKRVIKPKYIFLYFLMAQGLMLIGSIIGQTLNNFISALLKKEISDNTSEMIGSSPIWLIILIVVVIGPIIEELIFRKILLDRLSVCGDFAALIVTSIAFGLFHGNLYQFFYAALIGLILGYVYLRSGKIIYPIIIHMVVNFFGSVAAIPFLEKSERLAQIMEDISNNLEYNVKEYLNLLIQVGSFAIVQYAIYISGLILLFTFLKNKRFKLTKKGELSLPAEKSASAVVSNTGFVLFILLSIVMFATSILL